MHKSRAATLTFICRVGAITKAHYANVKNLKDIRGKGYYKAWATVTMFNKLCKGKMIEKLPINEELKTKPTRWQYYRATDKAYDFLELPKPRTRLKVHEQIHHNHGLLTCVSSLYKHFGNVISVEYPGIEESVRIFGFKIDCVMTLSDGRKYVIEFENNKSFNETVSEVRSKIAKFKRDKRTHLLFIFHNTRSADNNTVYPASMIHYEDNPDRNRLNLKFVADLLYELRDLEGYKPKLACFYEFDKFGEAVWRVPGHRETFMLQ